MPNFDDIDLGIICITVIVAVVGLALAFTGKITAGLGFMGTGITAIATLAGRRQAPKEQAPPRPVPPVKPGPDVNL